MLTAFQSAIASPESDWDTMHRAAVEALDTNRYWIAEPLLKKGVPEAEKFGFDNPRLSSALHELGRYYTIRGRFAEAEPCFEKELEVRQMSVGKDADQIIQAMGSLVRFYLSYGDPTKGDRLTEDMLALLDGKMKDTKVRVAAYKKGAPIEAWLGTASLHRDPVLEWAITCDTIGKCYRARKNMKLSEKLFRAALDMKTSILGLGHLSLASTYAELGLLYMENDKLADAEPCFREAYNSTELVLPPESTEVYAQMDRLARCLIKEKRFEEAAQLYQKALASLKKRDPQLSGGDRARTLFALGCLYIEDRRFAQAAPFLSAALEANSHFNGPCQIGLVPYLEMYAYCLYYLGRRGECDRLRARAEAIMGPEMVAERERERAKRRAEAEAEAKEKGITNAVVKVPVSPEKLVNVKKKRHHRNVKVASKTRTHRRKRH